MLIRAAAVEIDISPPIRGEMAGYGARAGVSRGLHDPLKAQVLVLESDSATLFILSVDLLAVLGEFTWQIRKALNSEFGVEGSQVILACSHTHSGPQGFLPDLPILGEKRDEVLQEITLRKLIGACHWAKSNLRPAQLSVGFASKIMVGLNRNDPVNSVTDLQLSLLRVDDLAGNVIAVLYNYGCHPTVLGPDNLWISADYPGASRTALKEIFPSTVFLFTNGAAGDVSTRFTRREASFKEVERLGQMMAAGVLQAFHTAVPIKNHTISSLIHSVELPLKEFPTIGEIETILQTLNDELEQKRKLSSPQAELRKIITKIEGAEMLIRQNEYYHGMHAVEAELQVIRIGDLVLAGIPGEPYSQTVLDLKQSFPLGSLFVISYANDYKGYFPQSVRGAPATYEDYVSPFTGQAAVNIRKTILQMIKELF